MAILTGDMDLKTTWLRCYFGGNGDTYLQIISEDENGFRSYSDVRITNSGGNIPVNVKTAAAQLARAMEENGCNDFPD